MIQPSPINTFGRRETEFQQEGKKKKEEEESQITKDINQNFRTKTRLYPMNEFNCRMGGIATPQKKNSESEERTVEISQSKQQRENRVGEKKMNVGSYQKNNTGLWSHVTLSPLSPEYECL